MWYFQYLRAHEVARERIAEAEEWRRARAASRSRSRSKPRRPLTPRHLRTATQRLESR